MVNIYKKDQSLKITWIKRIWEEPEYHICPTLDKVNNILTGAKLDGLTRSLAHPKWRTSEAMSKQGSVRAVAVWVGLLKWDIPPASTKLKGGYTGITLSVCPSVDRIVSALYLQQYSSDPFHICTSYQATSEGVLRVMPISKLKNLKFWRIF